MELSQLFMIAAVTKTSYEQCRALLIDNDQLYDDVFLLICEYTIALSQTYKMLEDLIINHKDGDDEDNVKIGNKIHLNVLLIKCAALEDKIQERICLTIH